MAEALAREAERVAGRVPRGQVAAECAHRFGEGISHIPAGAVCVYQPAGRDGGGVSADAQENERAARGDGLRAGAWARRGRHCRD